MATIKKRHRENTNHRIHTAAVVEELGDVLWYFAAICRRLEYPLETIFPPTNFIAKSSSKVSGVLLDDILVKLGIVASDLLSVSEPSGNEERVLRRFAEVYLQTVQSTSISLEKIVLINSEKVCSRFLVPKPEVLQDFDRDFPENERLPYQFEIVFIQKSDLSCRLQWNGEFIGDSLGDNISENDGYRFHDVFHIAYAVILHWSPVLRGLLNVKRKSNSHYDHNQDGGRAAVIEEGLTAWIFSQAKEVDFFSDHDSLSYDLLKGLQNFVRGYEVDQCPLNLWETAILEGYKIFKLLRKHEGGIVVGNRHARKITYRHFDKDCITS